MHHTYLSVEPNRNALPVTPLHTTRAPPSAPHPLHGNTTTSASFDIRTLYHREKNRDDHRQELYDTIVRKVHHRVQTVALRKETQCLFEVPQFILGTPLYDPFQCTGYVIQTLKAQGFLVQYYHPNVLHINWARHAIEPFVRALDKKDVSRAVYHRDTGTCAASPLATSTASSTSPDALRYTPTGKLFGTGRVG